jgi:hypothetical protein
MSEAIREVGKAIPCALMAVRHRATNPFDVSPCGAMGIRFSLRALHCHLAAFPQHALFSL